jgi:chromosome segregation ATPase
MVQNLQQDLDKIFQFVNGQEEELKLQRETIEELEQTLSQAKDTERWNVQRQLTDEQEAYQMLDQTLVGQRRNLREREEVLSQHRAVLSRRQGHGDGGSIAPHQKLALGPILGQIEQAREQQAEELQKLEGEIEQMEQEFEQAQETVNAQAKEVEDKQQAIAQLEANVRELLEAIARMLAQVNLYEEMLQPLQDKLNEVKQKLEEVAGAFGQVGETQSNQQQAIAQMRDILTGLINGESSELAAS